MTIRWGMAYLVLSKEIKNDIMIKNIGVHTSIYDCTYLTSFRQNKAMKLADPSVMLLLF